MRLSLIQESQLRIYKSIYKKYDEMIADLDYDEAEDIVKFNNTDKSDLNCVSVLYYNVNIEMYQTASKGGSERRR